MGKGKTSSDSLFQLIKSLSRTEKRYFKLYISRHNLSHKGVNEILFNAIGSQTVYDENAIIERFKKEDFVKSLSVAKTRLYKNIIDSLQFFHSGKSIDNTLYQYLNEIEILFQKSLYDQCWKILKKAIKLSEENKKTAIDIMLFQWKIRLSENKKYLSKKGNIEDQEFKILQGKLNQMQHEFEVLNTKTKFFKALYAGKVNAANNKIKKLISALEYPKAAHSPKSKLAYYQIKAAWYFALNNQRKSNEFAIKALAYISENDLEAEISMLGNIVYTSISIKDYLSSDKYLGRLKQIQSSETLCLSEMQRIKLFENIASLDLYLHLRTGKIDLAYEIMADISRELSKYNGQISTLNRASFYFNFAQICLIKADYKAALGWINQLLNYPGIDKNERIFSHGIMLSLIIHYELGNYGYVISKIKSVERYLQNRDRMNEFSKIFLKHMMQLARSGAENDETHYTEWKRAIKSLCKNNEPGSLGTSFNLNIWIESKIRRMSMAELMT